MNISASFQTSPQNPDAAPLSFSNKLLTVTSEPLAAFGVEVLQVNLGYRCNMACTHCHVSAGPTRQEIMGRDTIEAVLKVLCRNPINILDITGGAPELNPHFRFFVSEARDAGKRVMVRTNLTVFFEPGMTDLPDFFCEHGVELIASLPCYLEQNVNAARGDGAYAKSVEALRRLNALGYGKEASLPLHLVYNPAGPFLPPQQSVLEADYKRELKARYGVAFTGLYVFTNMPIGRFRESLVRRNGYENYLLLLASAFNPAALDRIMCRKLVSVGWDGSLYDCDFNQMNGTPVNLAEKRHISDFDYHTLSKRMIAVGDHCYGCTAGQGST